MENPVSIDELQSALSSLDELIARDVLLPLEPEDVTIARVMERAGIGYKGAQDQIAKWVQSGDMEYIGKRRNHSQPVDVWRVKAKSAPHGSEADSTGERTQA